MCVHACVLMLHTESQKMHVLLVLTDPQDLLEGPDLLVMVRLEMVWVQVWFKVVGLVLEFENYVSGSSHRDRSVHVFERENIFSIGF